MVFDRTVEYLDLYEKNDGTIMDELEVGDEVYSGKAGTDG